MKKLAFLLTAVLVIALSSHVFGQSYIAPHVGDEYTYKVTAPGTNTFAWDVTSDVDGNTSVVGTVASFADGTDDAASVQITWDNPATDGTVYYVHVTVTSNGCSNRKVLAVVPVNAFVLDIASVDLTNADEDNGEDYSICPADIEVTAYNGSTNTDFNYDYGRDSVYYKISASGINTTTTGWSPQFTIGDDDISGTVVSAGWSTSINGAFTNLTNLDGTTANDIDVSAGNDAIWIKVVIDNADTNGSGNEGTTANNILVTLLDDENTSEDGNGNDVTNLTNASRNQIISARPTVSDIITE